MFAKTKDKWLSLFMAVFLGVGLWIAMSPVAYSQTVTLAQAEPINSVTQLAQADVPTVQGSPLTAVEKASVKQSVLSYLTNQQPAFPNPPTLRITANQPLRFRVLKVKTAPNLKDSQVAQERLSSVLTFDYLANQAKVLLVDVSSGEVVSERTLPGQPQVSEEERAVATEIAQANPEVASLLQAGNVLENTGFIVPGESPRNRYAQLKVITPDASRELKRVLVNLTTGAIASVFTPN